MNGFFFVLETGIVFVLFCLCFRSFPLKMGMKGSFLSTIPFDDFECCAQGGGRRRSRRRRGPGVDRREGKNDGNIYHDNKHSSNAYGERERAAPSIFSRPWNATETKESVRLIDCV